jgi:menaquinone-9 beta-reductase
LAAAIAARQKGLSVTLADGSEPPIDKPCGEGLMPDTLEALGRLGIRLPAGVGYRFRGVQFIERGLHAAADFQEGCGIGIRRPLLHELLAQKAKESGVRLLWNTPVSGISEQGVRLSGRVVPARWILGADGSASRIRKWSGLEAARRRAQRYATRRHYRVRPWADRVEIHWGERAQAYVTPISQEEVCIVMIARQAGDAQFERAVAGMPELAERISGAEQGSRERGAITLMHTLRRVAFGSVALVGDASGGVDAITGEGMRLTFQQATAVAEAIARGELRAYEEAHRKILKRPLWMGKLILQLDRSARLRRRMLGIFAENPRLFAQLLSIHLGQATTGRVLSTGAQLGWEFLAA